jgi:hypothetical protein
MLTRYDAGLLNDFGGGNVEWWQDYLRAELERAHDHYDTEAADRITSLQDRIAQLEEDKVRLDHLQNESLDLCCFDIPTGGGDADIGWKVIGHYQAEPQEREMGVVWHDDCRVAIDRALTNWRAARESQS